MDCARIPRFDRELAQLPRAHSPYNGDVKMDAFQPADMTYAGNQRKGIRENLEPCNSTQDHVLRALEGRFPLEEPTPLPDHIKKRQLFPHRWKWGSANLSCTGSLELINHLVLPTPMAQWEFGWRPQLYEPQIGIAAFETCWCHFYT